MQKPVCSVFCSTLVSLRYEMTFWFLSFTWDHQPTVVNRVLPAGIDLFSGNFACLANGKKTSWLCFSVFLFWALLFGTFWGSFLVFSRLLVAANPRLQLPCPKPFTPHAWRLAAKSPAEVVVKGALCLDEFEESTQLFAKVSSLNWLEPFFTGERASDFCFRGIPIGLEEEHRKLWRCHPQIGATDPAIRVAPTGQPLESITYQLVDSGMKQNRKRSANSLRRGSCSLMKTQFKSLTRLL